MHPLEKEILKLIRKAELFQDGETVVVGVSGGPDSMALLHVLACLGSELNLKLIAVYLDHGLRPEETVGEADLVRTQADDLGISFVAGRVSVREFAQDEGLSTEHAARVLRYRFFIDAAKERSARKIAVAHTADDQAEEVLLRLIRGTGRKGLCGMKMVRDKMIVRPFLNIPKARLLEYLSQKKIDFLKDSSNQDQTFMRNRVRLDLIPYLAEHFNPNVSRTLRQTAAILQDEETLLEEITKNFCSEIIEEKKGDHGLPVVELRLDKFPAAHIAIQRRVLETVFWKMGAEPRFRQVEQILKLAGSGETGSRTHLARGLRVNKTQSRLCFSYPGGKVRERGDLEELQPLKFEVFINGPGTYYVPEIRNTFIFEELDRVAPQSEIRTQGAEFLDLDLVSFPLVLRSVRSGDMFYPLGAPGHKKVNDFFSDLKIPIKERGRIPVLVSGGVPAALPGIRIAHNFRITPATKRVLKITAER